MKEDITNTDEFIPREDESDFAYSDYDYFYTAENEDETLETNDNIRHPSVILRGVFPENWLFKLENAVENNIKR